MAENTSQRAAELIGIIGIVGSLIFVGLEVRQSAIATRAATDAALADSFRDFNLMMASSPETARALAEHAGDPEQAPASDKVLLLSTYRAMFHIWSNAHRQHMIGTIDPVVYQSVLQELNAYAGDIPEGSNIEDIQRRQRMMRWAWQRERFLFNPEFRQFVDSALADNEEATP